MDLPDAFQTFFERIELRALAEQRIESAWQRLHAHLTAAYRIDADRVFIQGSTANGTAVRPKDHKGEIDLDIIIHGAGPGEDPGDALGHLRAVLRRDRDLEARLEPDEPGRPCVRLRYARDNQEGYGFHIDIAPARTGQSDGPLDVPMRGRAGWKPTAPREYTAWCLAQGEPFRRTVRMLKRWRDHVDAPIKSIILQVLISHAISSRCSDAERLTMALEGIRDLLARSPGTAPRVENPVLSSENLAARWRDDDYRAFRLAVGEGAATAHRALQSSDEATSHTLWKRLLGDDFPSAPGGGPDSVPPPPPIPSRRPNPDRGRQYG